MTSPLSVEGILKRYPEIGHRPTKVLSNPPEDSIEPLQNHRQGSIEPFASNPPFLGYPFKILPRVWTEQVCSALLQRNDFEHVNAKTSIGCTALHLVGVLVGAIDHGKKFQTRGFLTCSKEAGLEWALKGSQHHSELIGGWGCLLCGRLASTSRLLLTEMLGGSFGFFFLLGEGEGGVRGAGRRGRSVFFFEDPRRRGVSRRGSGRGAGKVFAANLGIGGGG